MDRIAVAQQIHILSGIIIAIPAVILPIIGPAIIIREKTANVKMYPMQALIKYNNLFLRTQAFP